MFSLFKNTKFIVPKFYLFIGYNLHSISFCVLGHLEVGPPALIMKYLLIVINSYQKFKILREAWVIIPRLIKQLQVGGPLKITKYLKMVRNSSQKSLKLLDNMHE